jgi:peptidylprolyl isomerase/FKBP-type peptidyl-prolyl cis-trans isomerase FklB
MRSITLKAVLAAGLLVAACDREPKADPDALVKAQAYMAANARKEGVKTLPSGLQYQIVRSGPDTGPRPSVRDEVKVHYEGKLPDGTVFDSSFEQGSPAVFQAQNLIPAWEEIIPLMQPGDEWIVTVPPELGYGERGSGPIPPNSVLIFRLQLIDVLKAGGGTALG